MNPVHQNIIFKALESENVKYDKLHLKQIKNTRYAVTINEEFYGIFDVEKKDFGHREEC